MKALAIIVALAAIAHGESRPRYGGTLEGSLLGAPVAIDPPLAQTHAELTVVGLVFDTLYVRGANGIEPHLATGLPVASPGKLRIELVKGVRFHDGTVLTAADVAASLERVRTTSERWTLAPIAAITANGDAIELVTGAAPADVAALLALPATAVTKAGRAQGERPIGTGPFAVESWDRKGRLVLRAFDQHFAGRPYLDQLILRWYATPDGEARSFENGEAQMSARGTAAFVGALPKFRAADLESPAALLEFVGFGRVHADVMAERSFRRALDLALARTALASVTSGERVTPSRSPLPGVVDGATDDLTGAKAALADAARRVKALAPDRLGALKLEVLIDETRPDDRELAERIALALSKLGIQSVITAVASPVLRERVKRGDCDLWIGQLAAPLEAPNAWWGATFAAGGDPWVEQRLAAGALDTAAAQKAFSERLPIVPLLFRAVRIWFRTDVRGLAFDSEGRASFADLFYYGEPARAAKGGKP